MPATLVSIDRLTIDVALLALCAGVLWYSARGSAAALYALLAAAALARDTGLLLVAAYCMYAVSARLWRRAALFATAALPVLAWYIYLPAHLPVPPRPGSLKAFEYPVFGIFLKLFQPESYALSPWLARLAQAADEVALCGFLLALGYAAWTVLHRAYQLEDWIMLSFIGLAIAFSRPDYWNQHLQLWPSTIASHPAGGRPRPPERPRLGAYLRVDAGPAHRYSVGSAASGHPARPDVTFSGRRLTPINVDRKQSTYRINRR